MNQRLLACAFLGVAAVACSDSSTVPTQPAIPGTAQSADLVVNGPQTRVFPTRGTLAAFPIINAGPVLYHGGPIIPVTKVAAMYWGNAPIYIGGPTPGTTGPGSADGSLIGYFLNNLGGSPYFNINTTYFDNVGGGHTVQNIVIYTQYWANNANVPPSNGSNVSNATIQAEIISGFTSGKWTYDASTIYAVFTAGNTNLGGGFGSQYCAYHGKFTYNGQPVKYAAMPYDNQYPTGCSFNFASPNNDPAADQEISTLAHEVEEATTDPELNAWYDAQGQENADKCAYTYGTTYNNGNGIANMKLGTKDFLIQQNWIAPNSGCAVSFGGGNIPPVANFTYSCTVARVCTFTSTSTDPDGSVVGWLWQSPNGAHTISTASSWVHTFPAPKNFSVKLTVTDNGGATNSVTKPVVVP